MASKVYVYGNNEWYRVDLAPVPEQGTELSPVASIDFNLGTTGDWTITGDCIYWTGGLVQVEKKTQGSFMSNEKEAARKLYRHRLTADVSKLSNWEVACPFLRFPRSEPRVFALDKNRIFVLGGSSSLHYNEGDDTERLSCQVYNLDTKSCDLAVPNLMDFCPNFISLNTCVARNKRGEAKQVVFYSLDQGYLVFFNVKYGSFRSQLHPNFALNPVMHEVGGAEPVVKNSTLYWFTPSLILNGYDFVQRRWFRSQPVEEKQLWEIEPNLCPVLVDMYNGCFMLLARTVYGKLVIAILAVSRPKRKPKSNFLCEIAEFFNVTVVLCRTLSPSTNFVPMSALAI